MKFAKVHGLGNDFVILNCLDDAAQAWGKAEVQRGEA